jgi:V/A-type H+-transporting ATPase subunit I
MGGWFGNIIDSFPAALDSIKVIKNALVIIDPMQEPITFLIVSLILGYIQVCYGIFLKMRHRMRRGNPIGALLDEGIWLVFINCLFFWLLLSALGAEESLIGQGLINMCAGLALLSGAARVWLHDRENPKLVLRILAGLYSLYDIVGIFSDVLSYSRLLALGLATGVIAMIVDMLSMMTADIPGVGFLVGVIIFVLGHIFNLVINTLGAFIHTGRLQFVEFFSKFFESGGKRYKPFRFESRYFTLTE